MDFKKINICQSFQKKVFVYVQNQEQCLFRDTLALVARLQKKFMLVIKQNDTINNEKIFVIGIELNASEETNESKHVKTWWDLADCGRVPAISLVAVGTLDKNGTIAEALCKHLPSNVIQPHTSTCQWTIRTENIKMCDKKKGRKIFKKNSCYGEI